VAYSSGKVVAKSDKKEVWAMCPKLFLVDLCLERASN